MTFYCHLNALYGLPPSQGHNLQTDLEVDGNLVWSALKEDRTLVFSLAISPPLCKFTSWLYRALFLLTHTMYFRCIDCTEIFTTIDKLTVHAKGRGHKPFRCGEATCRISSHSGGRYLSFKSQADLSEVCARQKTLHHLELKNFHSMCAMFTERITNLAEHSAALTVTQGFGESTHS